MFAIHKSEALVEFQNLLSRTFILGFKLKLACLNGHTDILVTIKELLLFLNRNYYRNLHTKFEINKDNSNMYKLTKRIIRYGRTDPIYR